MQTLQFFTSIRRVRQIFVALALASIAVPAAAQNIGFVDVPRLTFEAPQGKAKLKKLEAEFAKRRNAVKAQADKFAAEKKKVEKNSLEMSDEEREAAVRKLRDLQRDAHRAQREYKEDFARRRAEELGKLEKILMKAIKKVAESEQMDLVVRQAVYTTKKTDLTAKVLEELKQQ